MTAAADRRRRHSTDGFERLGVRAMLRRSSAHHRLLRVGVVIGAAITLGSTMMAIGAAQPIAIVLVTVLALGGALSTDGHVVLLTTVVLAVNWLTAVDDTTTPWVVPAAIGLLVLHAAAAALTVAPPAARLDPVTSRRWLRRTAVVALAAPATWLATVAFEDWSTTGAAAVLVAALVAVAVTAAWVRARSVSMTSG
ncbi:MAG: hypothetical protein U0Q03_22925 [Acidimicrobiales bacterium]